MERSASERSEDMLADHTSTIYINFVHFERWWKHRVGLLEADTPVIPEFFEFRMSGEC